MPLTTNLSDKFLITAQFIQILQKWRVAEKVWRYEGGEGSQNSLLFYRPLSWSFPTVVGVYVRLRAWRNQIKRLRVLQWWRFLDTWSGRIFVFGYRVVVAEIRQLLQDHLTYLMKENKEKHLVMKESLTFFWSIFHNKLAKRVRDILFSKQHCSRNFNVLNIPPLAQVHSSKGGQSDLDLIWEQEPHSLFSVSPEEKRWN